ncbi:hypothetical protein L1987_63777 [Smallanthus sonchifolius]|uniref:Uncharacterized protein n=1 Tax=Smallanthus sonchifolius TaxID=185202 RepID=A0ACB9CE28_9ASTR|nr:hypothetical protein L1987_63777 [Smallanthus sonchifolius]
MRTQQTTTQRKPRNTLVAAEVRECPMWLPAESSGTKSDALSPSATQKDLKANATSPRYENTVSAPMRVERP